jgi:hypothetical protein
MGQKIINRDNVKVVQVVLLGMLSPKVVYNFILFYFIGK